MQPGDDEILARALHEQLKPVRGPAPQLGHVRAALFMARDDTFSSREACRRADVSENAHTRVAALADRVRALLIEIDAAIEASVTVAPATPPSPEASVTVAAPTPLRHISDRRRGGASSITDGASGGASTITDGERTESGDVATTTHSYTRSELETLCLVALSR